eukprot:CAMPEP_0179213730 /NCGR_PEP_ID=MMETSP0797-20121207/1855_1 /TAXON_ID=47934 /ORGANISM="Dinophysis acuminata, Strain DAEP01" /LENGTH=228 /DNA_ID=CAMNT_0020919549 /DNA_START=44 /DNA_END=727 /DNA_ORIENTATION=+
MRGLHIDMAAHTHITPKHRVPHACSCSGVTAASQGGRQAYGRGGVPDRELPEAQRGDVEAAGAGEPREEEEVAVVPLAHAAAEDVAVVVEAQAAAPAHGAVRAARGPPHEARVAPLQAPAAGGAAVLRRQQGELQALVRGNGLTRAGLLEGPGVEPRDGLGDRGGLGAVGEAVPGWGALREVLQPLQLRVPRQVAGLRAREADAQREARGQQQAPRDRRQATGRAQAP